MGRILKPMLSSLETFYIVFPFGARGKINGVTRNLSYGYVVTNCIDKNAALKEGRQIHIGAFAYSSENFKKTKMAFYTDGEMR